MVFYLVGLGLADEHDITLKGLKAVQSSAVVYIEAYTSVLAVPKERLEAAWGVKIELAPRELCESHIEPILERARTEDVSMLVVGDPFGATTHCDLLSRAKQLGVPHKVVHNASIMNAIGCCGLQLYRFGETVSICFFTSTWRPDSFYDKVVQNHNVGLHTLALLDIKVREATLPSIARGKPQYLPPRFMTVRQACQQLISVEQARGCGVCTPATRAVGVARVGADDQMVVQGTLLELQAVAFGGPLHSMVLLGKCDDVESELLAAFCTQASKAKQYSADELKAIDEAALRAANAHEGIDGPLEDDDEDQVVSTTPEEPSMFGAPPSAIAAAEAASFAAKAEVDGGIASLDDFLEALETT
ncbi:hypothetical protein AB1Y20_010541 [Prymnesium parvum]|uniref:diphthine methyl ester synthase n=1 Tax=Prymnesium parvum TaxID=97485 RepID=A0AB34IRT5_PRYPA